MSIIVTVASVGGNSCRGGPKPPANQAMVMLETHSAQQSVVYEDLGQNIDLSYIKGVIKRRIWYFPIAFLLVVGLGIALLESQQPIYRAEGDVLVEAPGVAPDVVHPTITEQPDQRFEVFKQRILAADNLISIANKYNLFPSDRKLMSDIQLREVMRRSVGIKPVPLEMMPGAPTSEFSVTFDYGAPGIAVQVVNEFLTQILSEDANRRNTNATETAKMLESEVNRLKSEHNVLLAKIATIKQQQPDLEQPEGEDVKAKIKALAELEADLAQKSAIYSDEYPLVIKDKKAIAALKRAIAAEPQAAPVTNKANLGDLISLQQQQANLEKRIDEAGHVLTVARLGETMERNQQAGRLQIIRYPELPHDPQSPKKLKWLASIFALAGIVGAGSVLAAEMLDGSIRASNELAGIIDRRLIVTIPYLSTPDEHRRKRRNLILLCAGMVATLAAAAAGFAISHGLIDFDWIVRYWLA